MKWLLSFCAVVLVALACLLILESCSSTQQAKATLTLEKVQAVVEQGCLVVQPTLQTVAALDPSVGAVATANGLVCATVGALQVGSLQTLVSTGIPAIEEAITKSTLVPAQQKPIVVAALGVFQVTLQNALAALAPTTPTAASAP